MKVLVATARTQGWRKGDYHWCVEGELVWVQEPCAADQRDPDGGRCGCARGFSGLNSHRATTTARVAELDLERREYEEALRSSLKAQGWPTDMVGTQVEALLELTSDLPVGLVIERRLYAFSARSVFWSPAR